MTIKIEKGVPIPPHGNSRNSKYPFEQMQVGDSIFVPAPVTQAVVATAAWKVGKPLGWKFATRPVDGGMRCWRVA